MTRANVLAVAVLSGLVARWVSKHSLDNIGNLGSAKDAVDSDGLIVDYSKLAAAYRVDRSTIDTAIELLSQRGWISITRNGVDTLAKPVIDNIQKLYEGIGVIPANGNEPNVSSGGNEKHHFTAGRRDVSDGSKQATISHKLPVGRDANLFGHIAPQSSGISAKSEFAWFRDHFMQRFLQTFAVKYSFREGRDGKAIKNLLKHFAISSLSDLKQDKVAILDRLITTYFKERGRENFTGGYSLHGMWDNLGALQIKLQKSGGFIQVSAAHFNSDGSTRRVVSYR